MDFSVKIDRGPDGLWSWSVVHDLPATSNPTRYPSMQTGGSADTQAGAVSMLLTSISASLAGQVAQEARAQPGGIHDRIDAAAVALKAAEDALDQSGLAGAWPNGVIFTTEQAEKLATGSITDTKMAWPAVGAVITPAMIESTPIKPAFDWLIVPPDDAKTMRDAVIGDGTPQTQPGEQVLVGEVGQFDGQPPRFVVDADTPASMLTPSQLAEWRSSIIPTAEDLDPNHPSQYVRPLKDCSYLVYISEDDRRFNGWDLEDWQARMLEERVKLNVNIAVLKRRHSENFGVVELDESNRMSNQLEAMKTYLARLSDRIAAWVKA